MIPAHQEEHSIGGLLAALAPLSADTEIIVVCNGCRDRTAEVARTVAPWATVLDLPTGSKPAALDAGDAAATSFPRMYLDADVRIDAAAVSLMFAAVRGEPAAPDGPSVPGGLDAAAASPTYDLAGASWLVRSHQRFWQRLPANRHGLAGTNAMTVSRAGRARFTRWPALIGDDYFLDGLFGPAEKARIPAAIVTRPTSRRFRDCISRKARIHQGNRDIRTAGLRTVHTGGGAGGIAVVLRREPGAIVDLPAHLIVTVAARLLSWWRRRRGTSGVWFRDGSRRKT